MNGWSGLIRRSFSLSLASLHRHSSSAVYVNEADPSSLALWKSAKPFKQIPGPKCYPVIGALPTFLTRITKERPIGIVSLDWFKEYGSLYKLIIPGMSPALFTTDPDVFKVMVQNEASNKYPLRGFGFEDKLGWVSHKIDVPPFMFFTGGQEWKTLRSAMAKPATPRKVATFSNQLYDAAQELGTHWLSKKSKDFYITDIRDDLQRWGLKCVVWFVFNKDLPVFEEGNQMADDFAKAAVNFNNNIGSMLQALPLYKLYPTAPFKNFKKAVNDMHAIGESMMKSRFKQLQKLAQEGEVLNEERVSLVEHLLIKEKLTKEQALSQACDLLSAGVDASSNTAVFLLHHISKKPELQQALYDEVTSVCGLNGVPDFNDFQRMPLVRNCIKETLRLYPAAPIPRLAQTDMVIHGYKVPKNTSIIFELFLIGRDPKLYPNPEHFNPYRWEGKKEQDGLVTFGSLPFGAGVRMCYGRRLAELELHLLLANICRRFVLSTDQSSSLELSKLLALKSKNPVRLCIKEREHV
ncbi:PREDICTED: cytochrome P450 27C1-like [Amphimedon queenslandica]|uniref:Cytochrome P450 n=1 Tax=Amphimedon queenslandica TaxID=400682 RepID=A0A1X7USG9_AMPQE|nr:PREDICTED: cytochrome P450 27C1-like [Amphimedon queenslandica]|eukprot:XP_003386912.1 PREDICTED: cytochrome P450 27C1-like [Amphimedon queenslandica]